MNLIRSLIGTKEASKRLGVSGARVRQLILCRRLKAVKVGWAWLILSRDLEAVRDRPNGRPPTRSRK